ncbi:HOMEOBOX-LEUCINE ZIPPER PROTEIN MERISTEM L1 [Salix koriyanagi]|uniref:HOMEOBOX-LEUCINE ZIPPER PROTEIN MERISTEM L1 n=1 Tax=Salix koriyanagi TaxID=2511006 RepID=A0A9Q0X6H0_9ROSI|nr:HOMEOBOX-LEUCINE ZIPPER PROTEIN MERISTEM L1 [Salix koriyanagi]
MWYREALNNASCPNWGGPTAIGEMSFDEHHLRLENTRWREEIDRISAVAARYVDKLVRNYPVISPPMPPRLVDLSVENFRGKPGIGVEIYEAGDLLRSIGMNNFDGIESVLNEDEYTRIFPHGVGPKPWSTMFSDIVSRVLTLEVLSTGVARNYNGALQVMTAEFQLPTPLVPTRESYYVRYYKQHSDGTWVVVDVSLDNICPSPTPRCRRRPFGCLIQEMPNGYSKVHGLKM